MTSCRILSWPSESTVYPIRFAGTWSRYSKSAIPQLTSAATSHARPLRFRRCAYHANVMKTFEQTRRRDARTTGEARKGGMVGSRCLDGAQGRQQSTAVISYV